MNQMNGTINFDGFIKQLHHFSSMCSFKLDDSFNIELPSPVDNRITAALSLSEQIITDANETMLFPSKDIYEQNGALFIAKALDENFSFYIKPNEKVDGDWIVYSDDETVCSSFFYFILMELCFLLQKKFSCSVSLSHDELTIKELRKYLTISSFLGGYPLSTFENSRGSVLCLNDKQHLELVITCNDETELKNLLKSWGVKKDIDHL